MLDSTLYLRLSGFGDMLHQINIFFHLSDIFSFNPKIASHEDDGRNSLSSNEFLNKVGYANIIDPSPRLNKEKAPSLTEISSKIEEAYRFDVHCYQNPKLLEALDGKQRKCHPRLRALATKSDLYAEITKRHDSNNRIILHVRRGDVAQINPDDFPLIFDKTITAGKILHYRGVFCKNALKDEVPKGILNRFGNTNVYLETLDSIKEREGVASHILISDGFTKISQRLVEENSNLLLDKNLSIDTLERELEYELHPLMINAKKTIIGETESSFYDALFTAMGSRIIISKSPGFLWQISRLIGLNIEFIHPKMHPQRHS